MTVCAMNVSNDVCCEMENGVNDTICPTSPAVTVEDMVVSGFPGPICTVNVCAGRDRPGAVSLKVSILGVTIAPVFVVILRLTNPVEMNFGNGLSIGTCTVIEYGGTHSAGPGNMFDCTTVNANELTVR